MADLVQPHGYPLEEHFVTTKDGYILRLFRIPSSAASSASPASTHCVVAHPVAATVDNRHCSKCSWHHNSSSSSVSSSSGRPMVFLQHALMDSSAGWLLLGPKRSLALQLADAGFDVWLGNSRGNRYSRNHTQLDPDASSAFWDYSWDDLAQHDLPASIRYSMAVSGQSSLVYIGYSQGTMIGLAALASQPQLAASISLAVLIAPVAFTTAMTSPAFVLSSRLGFDRFALSQGWGEWGSFQQANSDAMMPICRRFPWFCLGYLTTFCGSNPRGNVEEEMVPLVFGHLPAGTSVKVMSQWAQSMRRGNTQHLHRFDYGSECSNVNSTGPGSAGSGVLRCNLEVYGQPEPPVYDPAAITTPLALFTGGRDTISKLADVELLKGVLQPGVLQLHQHQPDYGHLDFELGADAPELVYPELLQLVTKFGAQSQAATAS
uniref:Lipase n=1 Tax=Tetradesmus obliquus TaxID=3088 RepID=A0A383W053_TETOB|eukprot:jgi/Sobl393_1/16748/SZX70482.1